MALPVSFPFVDTPSFYSGTATSALVPEVFPVAINGRPYMVDVKSQQFTRQFDPRVRDSQDTSTAPGESAINPQGLWRRGEVSWHLGAGQRYSDTAEGQDYRFSQSKGVNPWNKGQLTLLNGTKRSLQTNTTNLMSCVVQSGSTTYVYVADGNVVRFSSDPFTYITATITNVSASAGTITYTTSSNHGFTAGQIVDITGVNPTAYNLTGATIATASTNTFTITNAATGSYVSGGTAVQRPVWLRVTTNTAGGGPVPNTLITGLETNGANVFIGWTGNDIWYTTPGSTDATLYFFSGGGGGGLGANLTYDAFGYAKNWGWAAVNNNLFAISPAAAGANAPPKFINPDVGFRWVGAAAGQNAVYVAGFSGVHSSIFKVTITSAGILDTPVVALELPVGEVVSAIHGNLGFILIGTNKGVRFCSTDNQNNLVAGALIPTTGKVNDFTEEDRFVWFTYSNYDGVSSGLGRLDLSVFTSSNTPAYATDLMYTSTNEVRSVSSFNGKRIFTVASVGVVVEDVDNLVASGSVTTGIYRWGIPDDKFAPRVDVRTEPLKGNVLAEVAVENQDFVDIGIFNAQNQTRHTYIAPENKFIEAAYRFTLEPSDTNISPILTRWMSRAYAAPARSRIISLPILLHERFNINNKDYYFDVALERDLLEELTASPRIVTYQEKDDTFSVIIEDARWQPVLVSGTDWLWEGTMTLIMRTITE